MVIGWCAFAVAVVTLYILDPGVAVSLVVLVVATIAGRRLLRRVQPSPLRGFGEGTRADLPIRLVATAILVLTLTALAERLGPAWSGLLNAFPVLTTIVAVFSHAQRGAAAAVAFLNGYLQAIPGFGLFCTVMTVALGTLGLWWALAAALALQLAWHATLVSRSAPDPSRPAPISRS
jgi:hypothetical protein